MAEHGGDHLAVQPQPPEAQPPRRVKGAQGRHDEAPHRRIAGDGRARPALPALRLEREEAVQPGRQILALLHHLEGHPAGFRQPALQARVFLAPFSWDVIAPPIIGAHGGVQRRALPFIQPDHRQTIGPRHVLQRRHERPLRRNGRQLQRRSAGLSRLAQQPGQARPFLSGAHEGQAGEEELAPARCGDAPRRAEAARHPKPGDGDGRAVSRIIDAEKGRLLVFRQMHQRRGQPLHGGGRRGLQRVPFQPRPFAGRPGPRRDGRRARGQQFRVTGHAPCASPALTGAAAAKPSARTRRAASVSSSA